MNISKIGALVAAAQKIVIIQADNPDADSLGSALALEQILESLGKQTYLYCGVDIPDYLKYLEGWSRVLPELPSQFDASIIVDASTSSLLEKLIETKQYQWLGSKPCIVLDHHAETDSSIDVATVAHIDASVSSTGELLYKLARELEWPVDSTSGDAMMAAILGDTQGLTNDLASAQTYRVVADLIDYGVDRVALEERRRALSKMDPRIYKYKAMLINQTSFELDGQLATVVIPQDQINEYSPLYNPGPLIQPDILQTVGVQVGIVFKVYADSKITAMIRSTSGAPIAGTIAAHFGGGGHPHAAGFKILDGTPFDEIYRTCRKVVADALNELGAV